MLSPYEKGFRSGSAIRETERPFMTPSRINLTVVAQFMCLFWGGIYHKSHSYYTLGVAFALLCLFIYFCIIITDRMKCMSAVDLICFICVIPTVNYSFSRLNLRVLLGF